MEVDRAINIDESGPNSPFQQPSAPPGPEGCSSLPGPIAAIKPDNDVPYKADVQWFRFPYHLVNRLWKFESYGPLAVYLALLRHTGDDGRCWPSKEVLAKETKLSKDRIRTSLRHLEKIGLIRSKVRKDRSSMYYVKSTLPPLKSRSQIVH